MATQKQPWKPAGERMAEAIEDGSYALTRAAVEGTTVTIYMRRAEGGMREIEMADVKWSGRDLVVGVQSLSSFAGAPCTYATYQEGDTNPPLFRLAIQGALTDGERKRVIEAYRMLLELKRVNN